MPLRKLKLLTILCITVNTASLYGQKQVIHQNLVWYGYNQTLQFNDKLYLQTEIQERHFINPTAQHQFLIRSHIHKLLGSSGWEASVGMCLFLQNPNEPEATTVLTIPELRPHIQMAYKQQLGHVVIDHRYRLEARFFHNTNASRSELEDGFAFGNYRFRYRLQATIPIVKIADNRFCKLKVNDEIHVNIGSKIVTNCFDQNRLYVGSSVDVLPNLAIELGYLNWFQQNRTDVFYNRDIVQLAVYHTIKLK
jgi:hypothetical protein